MSGHEFSKEQLQQYERDGYVIVQRMFDAEEVALLESVGRASSEIKQAGTMKDATGGESKIWITSERKRDIYNAYAHNPRIMRPMEQLLGSAVYLWHYKMMLKEPRVGGWQHLNSPLTH